LKGRPAPSFSYPAAVVFESRACGIFPTKQFFASTGKQLEITNSYNFEHYGHLFQRFCATKKDDFKTINMADVHDKQTRSYNMSRIKGKNTKPELLVRKFLFANGFRYRLHVKYLPGKPTADAVLQSAPLIPNEEI
jgi:hypothetical protein